MSTADLMLLGMLIGCPSNAYELVGRMEEANMRTWAKISPPTVYKNLVRLCAQGYLDAAVIREGGMPEKTVYTVNERGLRYFGEEMEAYAMRPPTVYIDFAAFFDNLHHLDRSDAERLLEEMREGLRDKENRMRAMLRQQGGKSQEAKAIIELYAETYSLFYTWACSFHLD